MTIIVSGRVQGVNFRSSTADRARSLGLTGWVKNRDDGRVEINAEGSQKKLETLVDWVRSSPAASWVTDLRRIDGVPTGNHHTFTILFT